MRSALLETASTGVSLEERRAPAKVLMLATVDFSIATLLIPLIDALQKAGFHVDCACADGQWARALRGRGYTFHRVGFKRRFVSLSHVVALIQLVALLRRERYDVLHVHTPVAQVLGRIAGRIAGRPIVLYTSHGFHVHESQPLWLRSAALLIERILGRHATDFLLTQSLEDARAAIALGIAPEERVLWIGNGVDIKAFRQVAASERFSGHFGLTADDRVIGFVGRLVREKGLTDLVEAMTHVVRAIPTAKLLVIGGTLPGDETSGLIGQLQRVTDAHRLEGKIIFAGFRDDISTLLPLMDVFVLPSWREGMPRSVLEAMASGLPVVATNIRGCREEVVHGETGLLVPPHDPLSLSRAIVQILSDPAAARQMGEEGHRRALSLFDEGVVLEKQLKLYERLLNERAARVVRQGADRA